MIRASENGIRFVLHKGALEIYCHARTRIRLYCKKWDITGKAIDFTIGHKLLEARRTWRRLPR